MSAAFRRYVDEIPTPIGSFAVVVDGDGRLRAAGFTTADARMEQALARGEGSWERQSNPSGMSAAVERYFAGERTAIDGLPVVLEGTPFQCAVWQALREIPCGETRSYLDLARRVGNPAAVRAVGLANGSNPVGLIVPCHRVIASNGSLTGYGGGLERKEWLLAHERGHRAHDQLSLEFA